MFYVVVLKTDTPDKPYAIHYTKLVKNYERKGIFKMFSKEFAEHSKEYYIECLKKNDTPSKFYVKKRVIEKVHKLAQAHGYFVKLPKNTWGKYAIPPPKPRKKPANKQFMVEPIPTEDIRAFVLESIADYSSVDVAARLMFQREIPVFSTKTRKFGVRTLFKNGGPMRHILCDENNKLIDDLKREVHQQKKQRYDTYVPPGRGYSYPGLTSLQGRGNIILEWNYNWYDDKKRVDRVCGALTKLYSETPGSRDHTQDAIPFKPIEHQYSVKVV